MQNGTVDFNKSLKQVKFSGIWTIWSEFLGIDHILQKLEAGSYYKIIIDINTKWDSSLVVIILEMLAFAQKKKYSFDLSSLPEKLIKLIDLSKNKYINTENEDKELSNQVLKNNLEKKSEKKSENKSAIKPNSSFIPSQKLLKQKIQTSSSYKQFREFVEFFGEYEWNS